MSKRIVDMTVPAGTPAEVKAAADAQEAVKSAQKMPGRQDFYYGRKNPNKPLKCDCGQPRMRGTGMCQKCKNETISSNEKAHEARKRKD